MGRPSAPEQADVEVAPFIPLAAGNTAKNHGAGDRPIPLEPVGHLVEVSTGHPVPPIAQVRKGEQHAGPPIAIEHPVQRVDDQQATAPQPETGQPNPADHTDQPGKEHRRHNLQNHPADALRAIEVKEALMRPSPCQVPPLRCPPRHSLTIVFPRKCVHSGVPHDSARPCSSPALSPSGSVAASCLTR